MSRNETNIAYQSWSSNPNQRHVNGVIKVFEEINGEFVQLGYDISASIPHNSGLTASPLGLGNDLVINSTGNIIASSSVRGNYVTNYTGNPLGDFFGTTKIYEFKVPSSTEWNAVDPSSNSPIVMKGTPPESSSYR